jgi:hypothetical protein
MRPFQLHAASLALFVLTACFAQSNTAQPLDPLVGCWSGEDYQPVLQRRATWFMNRKADGTFLIEFTAIERGRQLPIQIEEGTWSHKDGKYVVVTTKIDGVPVDQTDPHFTDEYVVGSVADGVMHYYHQKSKLTFTSRRVSCFRGDA